MLRLLAIAATFWAGLVWGQPVSVYSEFRRVGPFGKVIKPDSGSDPREILSPMAPRNGWTGFHVAITPPKNQWFTLHVAENPEDAFTVRMYRETFARSGDEWIPGRATPLNLPVQARLPETGGPEGQTTLVYWFEMWVAPDAPVRRVRVEFQFNIGDSWVIYPMEVRVMPSIVPARIDNPSLPLSPSQRSDTIALSRLRQFVCGSAVAGGPASRPDSLGYFLDRAALQDMALARAGGEAVKTRLIGEVLRLAGTPDSSAWCDSRTPPPNPEWYLRVRDFLLRGAD